MSVDPLRPASLEFGKNWPPGGGLSSDRLTSVEAVTGFCSAVCPYLSSCPRSSVKSLLKVPLREDCVEGSVFAGELAGGCES